jgi:vacuolar-type H+-ATPase catalytic subunit A/Vma1
MIKQHVVAALCTVLAQALHNPSVDVVSRSEMREYSRILQMLTTLAQKSPELQSARDLCMSLLSQVDAVQRVRQMQDMSIQEQGPFQVEEVIFS